MTLTPGGRRTALAVRFCAGRGPPVAKIFAGFLASLTQRIHRAPAAGGYAPGMSRHRCQGCDPELLKRWGRDVFCPGYIAQCLEDQLTEDSEEGRAIRAELAKEAEEERRRKAGPQ